MAAISGKVLRRLAEWRVQVMGYDLRGKGRDFRWSFSAWPMVLRIARDHGWIPTGTKAPKGVAEWPGYYESNDQQVVRNKDARNLATALEQAVSSMTDDEWREAEVKIGAGRSSALVEAALSFGFEVITDPSPWLKEEITSFITFCRAGAFRID